MLLPPGQIIHKDLSTSFTNFEELLGELRDSRISGYIRLNFWGYEGILILDIGKIIQGHSNERNNFLLGKEAVLGILGKSSEKDGTIDVHSVSSEVALTLASVLGATLYKDLNDLSEKSWEIIFNELDQEGITGYVDIQFNAKKGMATVFLLDGYPVVSVIMSNTGRIISGEQLFRKILEISQTVKASLKIFWNSNVERIQEEKLFILPSGKSCEVEFWNNLVNTVYYELNKLLKKNNFLELWNQSKFDIAHSYPCMDPRNNFLEYKNNKLKFITRMPLFDFREGMILSLALAIQKVPSRKRKKIKVSNILQRLTKLNLNIPENAAVPDSLITIKRIFQDY